MERCGEIILHNIIYSFESIYKFCINRDQSKQEIFQYILQKFSYLMTRLNKKYLSIFYKNLVI